MADRKSSRAPASIALYEKGLTALAPFASALLRRRARNGQDIGPRIAERRGVASAPRPEGPLVWLHAHDAPDLAALNPLIERITALGLPALVTTRTVAASRAASAWLPDGAIHQLAPIEQPGVAEKFASHWRPSLALIGPGELMPTLVERVRRSGATVVLVDGALSERAFSRMRRARRTIAAILSGYDLCLTRSDEDAERLSALGARHVRQAGDLRFDAEPSAPDPARLMDLKVWLGRRPVMVAAATCAEEAASVVRAHALAREQAPDLLTILAPADGEHAEPSAEAAAREGLSVLHADGSARGAREVDVMVAGEWAEPGLLYRVADLAFLGGSLVKRGGVDPVEPAKLGAPILHGPHVENFEMLYDALAKGQATASVGGPEELAAEAARLIGDPAARAAMARRARSTCARLGGALDRTLSAIEPYLMQLRLGAPAARLR